MPADPYLAGVLGKSYLTALLLTGSPEAAEEAVGAAMSQLADSEIERDSLLLATIRFALPLSGPAAAAPALPAELERILHLSSAARHSYVLRVLLGYPPALCARLLHLPSEQIGHQALGAMLQLAELAYQPIEVVQ